MGIEVVLALIVAASAGIAFALGRWWTVFVPVAALGIYYGGLNAGWWGDGVGDGWPVAMGIVMAAGVLAAALGVGGRRLRPRA